MKLVFAIVNNDDSHSVSSALTQGGYQATKLASTGGFLMAGNTTFMICSEDGKVASTATSASSSCRIPQVMA